MDPADKTTGQARVAALGGRVLSGIAVLFLLIDAGGRPVLRVCLLDLRWVKAIVATQHDAARKAVPMLFPWYAVTMLAIESGDVIGLRLTRMAFGGPDAQREAEMMVSEKVDALLEAAGALCGGATPGMVVARYREHVADNAARLSA